MYNNQGFHAGKLLPLDQSLKKFFANISFNIEDIQDEYSDAIKNFVDVAAEGVSCYCKSSQWISQNSVVLLLNKQHLLIQRILSRMEPEMGRIKKEVIHKQILEKMIHKISSELEELQLTISKITELLNPYISFNSASDKCKHISYNETLGFNFKFTSQVSLAQIFSSSINLPTQRLNKNNLSISLGDLDDCLQHFKRDDTDYFGKKDLNNSTYVKSKSKLKSPKDIVNSSAIITNSFNFGSKQNKETKSHVKRKENSGLNMSSISLKSHGNLSRSKTPHQGNLPKTTKSKTQKGLSFHLMTDSKINAEKSNSNNKIKKDLNTSRFNPKSTVKFEKVIKTLGNETTRYVNSTSARKKDDSHGKSPTKSKKFSDRNLNTLSQSFSIKDAKKGTEIIESKCRNDNNSSKDIKDIKAQSNKKIKDLNGSRGHNKINVPPLILKGGDFSSSINAFPREKVASTLKNIELEDSEAKYKQDSNKFHFDDSDKSQPKYTPRLPGFTNKLDSESKKKGESKKNNINMGSHDFQQHVNHISFQYHSSANRKGSIIEFTTKENMNELDHDELIQNLDLNYSPITLALKNFNEEIEFDRLSNKDLQCSPQQKSVIETSKTFQKLISTEKESNNRFNYALTEPNMIIEENDENRSSLKGVYVKSKINNTSIKINSKALNNEIKSTIESTSAKESSFEAGFSMDQNKASRVQSNHNHHNSNSCIRLGKSIFAKKATHGFSNSTQLICNSKDYELSEQQYIPPQLGNDRHIEFKKMPNFDLRDIPEKKKYTANSKMQSFSTKDGMTKADEIISKAYDKLKSNNKSLIHSINPQITESKYKQSPIVLSEKAGHYINYYKSKVFEITKQL